SSTMANPFFLKSSTALSVTLKANFNSPISTGISAFFSSIRIAIFVSPFGPISHHYGQFIKSFVNVFNGFNPFQAENPFQLNQLLTLFLVVFVRRRNLSRPNGYHSFEHTVITETQK